MGCNTPIISNAKQVVTLCKVDITLLFGEEKVGEDIIV